MKTIQQQILDFTIQLNELAIEFNSNSFTEDRPESCVIAEMLIVTNIIQSLIP